MQRVSIIFFWLICISVAAKFPAAATFDYGIDIEALTLSPDGKSLAFVARECVDFTIWRVQTDGTNLQQVGEEYDHHVSCVWSADSKKVFPVAKDVSSKRGKAVRVVNGNAALICNGKGLWFVNSSGLRTRLPVEGIISEPTLSRDGKHAFCISYWERSTFNGDTAYYSEVFSVSTDGTRVKQLTNFSPQLFRSSKEEIVALDVLSMTQVVVAYGFGISLIAAYWFLKKRRRRT